MSLRNTRGFSLVELAVVLLIAGLVLAFSMPTINRTLTQQRLRDSAARVMGEMRTARQKAITNNSRAWFYAFPSTNYYYVGEQRWVGGLTNLDASFGAITWKGPYYLPNTVRIVSANFSGPNYFWYTPKGTPGTSGLPNGPTSGLMRLASTVGAPDTVAVNVDLSGSVWKQ